MKPATPFTNTTLQNQTKMPRLKSTHTIPRHHASNAAVLAFVKSLDPLQYSDGDSRQALLYSIGQKLLQGRLSSSAQAELREYETRLVPVPEVPLDSFDLLGSVYQYLLSKSESLMKGAFYTGGSMASDHTHDLSFDGRKTLLDPACGSGMFLFSSSAPPESIYGVDNDRLAIMIAKMNYYIKFPDGPNPKLVHSDFFEWYEANKDLRFDYIVANPPYGASMTLPTSLESVISSGESFSYFIEFSLRMLQPSGIARFLIPDSLLNVRRHRDVRDLILNQYTLQKVKRYSARFSGLMSDVHQIEISHLGNDDKTRMVDGKESVVSTQYFRRQDNLTITFLGDRDVQLIEQIQREHKGRLTSCRFGLGVVTGQNSDFLKQEAGVGLEPIYTGKEIAPYTFRPPMHYIKWDRAQMQQVAPDAIYRAPLKLVYKTIASILTVAIDRTKSLTTNSANIIVPDGLEMSGESLAAILNSSVASYLYVKCSGRVNKIGKEHLLALPIPAATTSQDAWLQERVKSNLSVLDMLQIDDFVGRELYGLSDAQMLHVRSELLQFGGRFSVQESSLTPTRS
jgi:hypothetical protein